MAKKMDKENKESKNKKEQSNMGKYIIFTIVIIVVISLIGFLAYKILVVPNTEEKGNYKLNESEIKGYGIHLDDGDTKLYREEYTKLKENLESKDIDYDAYAESVAKLFIIDLYTIKNKINKYDSKNKNMY